METESRIVQFGICKTCDEPVHVVMVGSEVVGLLHDLNCVEADNTNGDSIFREGLCIACMKPGVHLWRKADATRRRVGHDHPELTQRLKDREAAGEDIYAFMNLENQPFSVRDQLLEGRSLDEEA